MRPVLVTRAEPGASRTVERLSARGVEAVNAATAAIEYRTRAIDLAGVALLAFTSPNAVGAFVQNSDRRDLPVMAVGAVTASAARAAGFSNVTSADGDGAALGRLIASAPPDGPVLHVTGADQGYALAEALGARGVTADTLTLYEAVETGPLSAQTAAALQAGAVILIHSPLGARRFAGRIDEAGLRPALAGCDVAAISAKAAAPLAQGPLRSFISAETPDEEALFTVLDQILARTPR
ncbi:MAG: uroporphyrinogen-III synthase [Oceanicaulis sp.]